MKSHELQLSLLLQMMKYVHSLTNLVERFGINFIAFLVVCDLLDKDSIFVFCTLVNAQQRLKWKIDERNC